jgi:hypothetical protein
LPDYFVVSNVIFKVTAASESAALEAVESGTAGAPEPISAVVYGSERDYLNAAKVSHASRRQWKFKKGRRG